MDESTLYTSGQVSGITLVQPMALYRYVKEFREFFSPSVQQQNRGRRWSLADVELILSIQALYHDRTGKDTIREMLAGGWRLGKNPFYSREVLANLLDTSCVFLDQAEQIKREAKRAVDELGYLQKTILRDHDSVVSLRNEVAALRVEVANKKLKRKFFGG